LEIRIRLSGFGIEKKEDKGFKKEGVIFNPQRRGQPSVFLARDFNKNSTKIQH